MFAFFKKMVFHLLCRTAHLPPPDHPPPDCPNFRYFFPLPPPFRSFLSLGVFSWNFGGVFEGRDPQMRTFGLSKRLTTPPIPYPCRRQQCTFATVHKPHQPTQHCSPRDGVVYSCPIHRQNCAPWIRVRHRLDRVPCESGHIWLCGLLLHWPVGTPHIDHPRTRTIFVRNYLQCYMLTSTEQHGHQRIALFSTFSLEHLRPHPPKDKWNRLRGTSLRMATFI